MPGDEWQKFASLRLLFSYMWALPGKKLLFMGDEFGQWSEWNHDASLDWQLLDRPAHGKLARLVGTLNHIYKTEPAMHRGDAQSHGFEWLDGSNAKDSVLTFMRRGDDDRDVVVVAVNFTPVAAQALSRRRAAVRALARDLEQRRHGARRQRPGQPRRSRVEADPLERPSTLDKPHVAAARSLVPQADAVGRLEPALTRQVARLRTPQTTAAGTPGRSSAWTHPRQSRW